MLAFGRMSMEQRKNLLKLGGLRCVMPKYGEHPVAGGLSPGLAVFLFF